jgi:xylulose-5-phosphate/fructose-6-phosphate phosphoketolase
MVLGNFLRDVTKLNQSNFRIFGPDETLSNLLGAVFEITDRQWDAREVKTMNSSRRQVGCSTRC